MTGDSLFGEVRRMIGQEIGLGDWFEVTQPQVDVFADITHDHQFIHVDPERAAQGLYGATVAHGYLTLALLPHLRSLQKDYRLDIPHRVSINYGLDRLRFITPVRIPSRIRLRTALNSAETPEPGAMRLVYGQTVEIEGGERPALYAETITHLVL